MEEKKVKNILLINEMFESSIASTKELIKDFISLGHKVTVYTLEEFEERLKDTGAKIKPIKLDKSDLKNIPPFLLQRVIFSLTLCKSYEPIINDGLKSEEKYDFLIVDSFYDGNELNKIFKAPTVIALYNSPIGDKSPFIELSQRKRMEPFNEVNKKFNLNIRDFLSLPFIADAKYKFMFFSKIFQKKPLDESFYFIGANNQEDSPVDESFNFKKDESKKLINISLDLILNQNADFYNLCIQTFGNCKEYQIILNVGDKIDIKQLGQLPDNIFAFNKIPLKDILPITDVIITDGRTDSINKVLYYNKNLPLILLKQDINEFDCSKIIKNNEAGIILNNKQLSPEYLKETVNDFITNITKYQKGFQKIAESNIEAKSHRKEIFEKIFG